MHGEQLTHHEAVQQLTDYLDDTIPDITLATTSSSVFAGAAALYRCNRLLRSIDDAVEHGLGDTAGGNVRTLYETWVYGHVLMLSDHEEARSMVAMTRGQARKVIRGMQMEGEVLYPTEAPEALHDTGTRHRATVLAKKLRDDDPKHASLPELCYDYIFRPESHFGVHANVDIISQYVARVGDADAAISLNGQDKDQEHRTRIALYMTSFFASHVLRRADVDMSVFSAIEQHVSATI